MPEIQSNGKITNISFVFSFYGCVRFFWTIYCSKALNRLEKKLIFCFLFGFSVLNSVRFPFSYTIFIKENLITCLLSYSLVLSLFLFLFFEREKKRVFLSVVFLPLNHYSNKSSARIVCLCFFLFF